MKKLPIGVQTFSLIREEDDCYVDKTPLIVRLADEGKYYFLSRPRRFGKSLLVSTLAEAFAGNRALEERSMPGTEIYRLGFPNQEVRQSLTDHTGAIMDFDVERLLATLRELPRPPGYWVAFSGGLDSTCLLHALAGLRGQLGVPLRALHLDHGLHPASGQWARHCRQVCAGLGVPLTVRALALSPVPGVSLEALARQARRAAFAAQLDPGELLLTAQHRDDQAETLLLQLLRGSGLHGLAAMPRLMELSPGWLARPLLDCSRADLRAYALAQGLSWVEDPSNAESGFDRNYLRHQVLPLLARRWPAYAKTLARSAGHCGEAAALIDYLAEGRLAAARGSRPGSLSVAALRALEPPLYRALLRRWIRSRGGQVPDSRRRERIRRELLPAAPDRSPRVEWPGAEVRRYRDDLHLLPPLPPPPRGSIPWPGGDVCELPAGLGRLRLGPASGPGLDPACRARGVLEVRFGVPGVRCRLPGAAHRTRLKDLFQRHGVPDWLRPFVPLVYLGGELVAVAGVCLCPGASAVLEGGLGLTWEGHPFAAVLGTD
jgi:tRNA(Ile)-lysidine synthase